MNISGHVSNGVVVLDGGAVLPEGAAVTVCYPSPFEDLPVAPKKRIQVPLIRTGEPGSLHFTNEQIAELFEKEDIAALASFVNDPEPK